MGRWARKPVNHTSWVAVVTPTDRPKSVRNRCLIELFCGVVCVVTLPFWHFCWCRGFCHRTESDLFLFLQCKFPKLWVGYLQISFQNKRNMPKEFVNFFCRQVVKCIVFFPIKFDKDLYRKIWNQAPSYWEQLAKYNIWYFVTFRIQHAHWSL